MDRSVHARKLRLDASRRIIAISDIHGNDALLKRLLQKVDYQPQNDVLLLLGDLIEMQFLGAAYNPHLGSAISLVMMVIVLVCMGVMNRFGEGEEEAVLL